MTTGRMSSTIITSTGMYYSLVAYLHVLHGRNGGAQLKRDCLSGSASVVLFIRLKRVVYQTQIVLSIGLNRAVSGIVSDVKNGDRFFEKSRQK